MSVLRKETAVNNFAETQLVRIIVYAEMGIIFIKMETFAWVGNAFFFIKVEKIALVAILYSLNSLLNFSSCYYCRQ